MFQRSSERRTDRVKKSCVRKVASLLAQPLRRKLGDELAVGFAVPEELQGLRHLFEGNRLEDEGVYLALLVEPNEVVMGFGNQPRHNLVVKPPVESYDRVVLYEGVVGGGIGDPAARETHHDYAPLEGDTLSRKVEDVAAHG